MHCTQCGSEGEGPFCAACGAAFHSVECPACDETALPGSRFCPECGAPLGAKVPKGAPDGGSTLPWAVSGVLMVALIVVAAFPMFGGGDAGPPQPPMGAGPQTQLGPTGAVDLSSMSPREAADRLFERVAFALSAQDSAEVVNFVPMAVDAYELARPLDTDGLFHLALLQRVSLEFEASLATALEGLEEDPDHVLLLSAAAEAHLELGRDDEAREYYARMLDVWDEQMERELEDYEHHQNLLPILREDAEALVGGTDDG